MSFISVNTVFSMQGVRPQLAARCSPFLLFIDWSNLTSYGFRCAVSADDGLVNEKLTLLQLFSEHALFCLFGFLSESVQCLYKRGTVVFGHTHTPDITF